MEVLSVSDCFFFKFPKSKISEFSITFFSLLFQSLKSLISLPFIKQSSLFSVNLPMVNIIKFCKKYFFIHPPGEPRDHHIGVVRPKKFVLQKISYKTKWPEGSIYSVAFLRKLQKSKKRSHRNGKTNLLFWVLWLQFL